jgi:signal transduction histidine kinase
VTVVRAVDARGALPESDRVNRALAVLTGATFVVVLLGLPTTGEPLLAAALALAFTVLATAGFAAVRRRGRVAAYTYVAAALVLAYAVFAATNAGAGATLMLLLVVVHSVILLPLPAAVVVTALVPLVHLGMSLTDGLREGLGTLIGAVFAAVVTTLLLREQQARGELAAANAQLRDYAAQAEQLATTQERNRVARDIHDGLGHHLTVVQKLVEAARTLLPGDPERAEEILGKAQHQAEDALAEVRRSVGALREPRPTPPLAEALRELAAETSAAGVPTELELTGPVRVLAADREEVLFRAAQEGLTNVRKHAGAASARLVLAYGPDVVGLDVCDDGVGADPGGGGGFGLVGLRERAARLGGRLDVRSTPGQGLLLHVEVPT